MDPHRIREIKLSTKENLRIVFRDGEMFEVPSRHVLVTTQFVHIGLKPNRHGLPKRLEHRYPEDVTDVQVVATAGSEGRG